MSIACVSRQMSHHKPLPGDGDIAIGDKFEIKDN